MRRGLAQVGLHAPVGFQALGRVIQAAHDHAQPEAVQDLRAQAAFLGVHRADQHETGPVGGGDRAAPDGVTALGGRVQDGIDNIIREQVDLVNVEQVAVGLGQDAAADAQAFMDGGAFVDPADHILQAGVERQLHQPDPVGGDQRLAFGVLAGAVRADRIDAAGLDIFGQAAVIAQGAFDLGKNIQQGADGGGLGGAARADQQDAAHGRIDQPEQERQFHLVLADNRQEGEGQRLGQPDFFGSMVGEAFAGNVVDQFTQGAEGVGDAFLGFGFFGRRFRSGHKLEKTNLRFCHEGTQRATKEKKNVSIERD